MRRLLTCAVVATLALVICPTGASGQAIVPVAHQLKVVRQTAFVGPNGTFTVEVSTGDLPANTRLDLVVYGAVYNRSRLDRTIAGEQLGTALYTTPNSTTTASRSNVVLSLPIKDQWPAPEGGTVLSESGVYPVAVQATSPTGARLDTVVTHLLRLPSVTTPTNPLSLATTVVLDTPLGVAPDGTPQVTDAQLSRAREQFRILNAAASTPLTMAATPFLVQALVQAGDTSVRPDSRVRQTLSRPYVAIDAGALEAAGRESTIAAQYTEGDSVLASAFEASPDRRTLVLDPSVTPSALELLGRTGTRSVVIQSSQIRSSIVADETSTLTRRFVIEAANGTAFSAMANDDTASARFVLTNDPVLGAHHALAELMMLHVEQPGTERGVAITVPAATEPAALAEFLTGLATINGASSGSVGNVVLQPTTLDDLFARTAVASTGQRPLVRSWTSNDPVPLGSYSAQLEQAQWDLVGLRSLLPDGEELVTPVEQTTLASAEATLSSAARVTVLDTANAQLRAITGAISLPSSQRVTLTSQSGRIPLVITNALPVTARVRIKVSSPKLEFPEGTVYELTLAPSATTRNDLAVTTRASGAFPLDVEVTSSGGALLVTGSRIDVRSTAISGFGLLLSIGAGLFLLVWWARHFRHTRRARALVGTDEPSPDAGG